MRERPSHPWRVLGFAVMVQSGVSVVEQGLPALTGFVKADLGVSAGVAGLAVSSLVFGKVLGSYAAGLAADRLGERQVMIAGGLAVGALTLLATTMPTALTFSVLAFAGIASSTSTPAGGRLVLLAFPRDKHGIALGIRQCGIPIGGLVAAAVLPVIAHRWSWRWGLDVAGAIAMVTVLPLLVSPLQGRHGPELPAEYDSYGRAVARDRDIRLLTVWGCLVVTGQYVVVTFLALDLHQSARLSLAGALLLVAVANACGIVGRILWGALSDRAIRYGRKPFLLTLNAAGLVAALGFFVIPRSAPIGIFVALSVLAGFALIGYQGLFITMVAEMAGPRRVGAATGFAATFVQVAIALTPPVYGFLADATGSYRAVWGALTCVLLLALVPALLAHEPVPARRR